MSFGKQPPSEHTSRDSSSRQNENDDDTIETNRPVENELQGQPENGLVTTSSPDHFNQHQNQRDDISVVQTASDEICTGIMGDGKRAGLHQFWGSTGPVTDIPQGRPVLPPQNHPSASSSRVGLRRAWSASCTKSRRNSDGDVIKGGGVPGATGSMQCRKGQMNDYVKNALGSPVEMPSPLEQLVQGQNRDGENIDVNDIAGYRDERQPDKGYCTDNLNIQGCKYKVGQTEGESETDTPNDCCRVTICEMGGCDYRAGGSVCQSKHCVRSDDCREQQPTQFTAPTTTKGCRVNSSDIPTPLQRQQLPSFSAKLTQDHRLSDTKNIQVALVEGRPSGISSQVDVNLCGRARYGPQDKSLYTTHKSGSLDGDNEASGIAGDNWQQPLPPHSQQQQPNRTPATAAAAARQSQLGTGLAANSSGNCALIPRNILGSIGDHQGLSGAGGCRDNHGNNNTSSAAGISLKEFRRGAHNNNNHITGDARGRGVVEVVETQLSLDILTTDTDIVDNSDNSSNYTGVGAVDIHSSQDFYIEDSYTESAFGGVAGSVSPPGRHLPRPLITVENSSSCEPSEDNANSPLLVPSAQRRTGKTLKVEFMMMDGEDAAVGDAGDASEHGKQGGLQKQSKKLEVGLRRAKGSDRWNKPRMSLLGKPLNYKAHKRDARYRRVQAKIYNFLERPKDWRAISYHLLVFLMVFICLLLSIFATIRQYEAVSGQLLYYLEVLMVVWFMAEFLVRIWSAGCRSRYQQWSGRIEFIRRPLCIVDIIVITASIIILCLEGSGQVFATSALRGLRFFQILRMVRVDRRGGSWKLLGSVVWAHRQELFTTLYIGFLGLIFSSFLVYLAEKEKNKEKFGTYADALWWGVITLCTVGYGDAVPITWAGKLIAAFCAILGISFFALPAGILGSGFALKVQQQQRQKHLIRRRVPAATLIQALWRCYAADENSLSVATWKPHLKPCRSPSSETKCKPTRARPPTAWYKMKEVLKMSFTASSDDDLSDEDISMKPEPTKENKFKHNSSFMSRLSTRRKERSHSTFQGQGHNYNSRTCLGRGGSQHSLDDKDSDEPIRRESFSQRVRLDVPDTTPFIKRESSFSSIIAPAKFFLREEDEEEPERLSELTDVHKRAIRAVRKIKYFVARRKFKEAFRPYDVKDVIEQYSAGHIDMLGRVKSVQCRLDLILGKAGSKKADVYESKISVASRIVKVERQVEDIESKLDLLIELIKDDRKHSMSALEGGHSVNQSTPQYPRLRSILTEKNGSEPSTPLLKNPNRPIFRNHSDLGPRLRKKVTYRNSHGAYLSESEPSTPVSILKKGSVSSVPSEPDIHEGEDNDRVLVKPLDLSHREFSFTGVSVNQMTMSHPNGRVSTAPLERCHLPIKRSSSDITKYCSSENVDVELGETDTNALHCSLGGNNTIGMATVREAVDRGAAGSSLEMISEKEASASHQSSVHSSAESVVLAPHNELFISETGSTRSDRYPSYNSTESEYMSDREDSPIMDSLAETIPLNSAYDSCAESSHPHRHSGRNECIGHNNTLANNQNSSNKINHLKPESQVLLMRPEVLKLRKTSC